MKKQLVSLVSAFLLTQAAYAATGETSRVMEPALPATLASSLSNSVGGGLDTAEDLALRPVPEVQKRQVAPNCYWVFINNQWRWVCV